MKANNPPAFPFTADVNESKPDQLLSMGMTLRDYFAAAALTGYIAIGRHSWYRAVEEAYQTADYMLIVREKKEE